MSGEWLVRRGAVETRKGRYLLVEVQDLDTGRPLHWRGILEPTGELTRQHRTLRELEDALLRPRGRV